MGGLVLSELTGEIATLTLNRPERHNSLIPELLRDLLDALRDAAHARALVLQANGRSFSTGGDVRGFYEHRAELESYSNEVVGLLNETILAMIASPMPIIAAVHGIVTGGSLGLALACDIVLVAPETTFTPFYTTVGYSPDGGWTAMLPAVIGAKRAAEALLLDRSITAHQAIEWGLANRIVSADKIRDEARAVANAIVQQKAGSVMRAKRLLWSNNIAGKLEEERQQFVRQIVSAEAQEGMAAFLHIKPGDYKSLQQ
ncbi:MAG: enoyl-CoA hydratase/isomerase family protein [Chloroflexi bacterium]|nr:enoyl-CoA hydratase/isomerase family protein [Chloroflexota bacterium]